MARRGTIHPETAIRRDGGLWGPAARTPGVAPFLGLCPHCQASATEAMDRCPSCEGDLWGDDREWAVPRGDPPRRSTGRSAARLAAALAVALLLVGAGVAGGRLYELRADRGRRAQAELSLPFVTPRESASIAVTPEPIRSAPIDTTEPATSAADTSPPDPFEPVLAAIIAEDYERASELLSSLARRPELAADAAAWADVIVRERRLRFFETLP